MAALGLAALLTPISCGLRAADKPQCLGTVVNASCWGWSATDSDLNSAALQAAVLSGAERVIVPKMPGPWVVNVSMAPDSSYAPVYACTPPVGEECCTPTGPGVVPLPDGSNPPCCILAGAEFTNCSSQWRAALYLPGNSSAGSANNTEIVFEPGVEVVAQRDSFRGLEDCLLLSFDASNITLIGYNASLRMWKRDYLRSAPTAPSCKAALAVCPPSPQAPDTCLACAGLHANELSKALCEDADIEQWCEGTKELAPYRGSQFRFATNWYRGDGIRIFGLTIRDSGKPPRHRWHLGCILLKMAAISFRTGGDGIDFGDGPPAMTNGTRKQTNKRLLSPG